MTNANPHPPRSLEALRAAARAGGEFAGLCLRVRRGERGKRIFSRCYPAAFEIDGRLHAGAQHRSNLRGFALTDVRERLRASP